MKPDALAAMLSEQVEDALLVLDAGGDPVFVSVAFQRSLGVGASDRDLRSLLRFVHREDRARVYDALGAEGERQTRVRLRVRAPESDWRRLELQVIHSGGHRLARLREVQAPLASDRSESAESALAEIAAHLEVAVWLIRISPARLVYVSPGYETVFERPRDGLADPRALFETIHPSDRDRVLKLGYASWRSGFEIEFRVALPDGAVRWVHHRSSPVRDERGEVAGCVGVTTGIDDRKAAEDALRTSEERLRVVSQSAFHVITELDARGRVTWVGPTWNEALRRPDEDPIRPRPDLIHPDERAAVVGRFTAALESEEPATLQYRIDDPWHECWRWIETTAAPLRSSDGERRALMMSRDISQRQRTVERLRESEERYRDLVESSPEAIFVHADDTILFANPAAADLVGVAGPEQLVGAHPTDFAGPGTVGQLSRGIARFESGSGKTASWEYRMSRADGELRDVIVSSSHITYEDRPALQSVVRDITEWRRAERERERLQAQLQEARKLESLGVLAGGVAHDFNNLLAVILGNTRFALDAGPGAEDGRAALQDSLDAASSASRLTRQLLAYAGRRAPEVRPVDVSDHTRSVGDLLETALPKKVRLELDLASDLPNVRADVVQLEQVTMNLLFNAAEAIGDHEGEVRITTGAARVESDRLAGWIAGEGLVPGEYVYLEVRDDGMGMDEEMRARIFDPFFTTKEVGHGLGLSAVLGFVRAHGGGIEIESRVGRGTAIRLFLPGCEDEIPEPDGALVSPSLLDACILVVDDEPGIRRMVKRVLSRHGCVVLEAMDGEEAIEICRRRSREIDAVVLDLNMPRVGGEDAMREIRVLRPDLPVLIASGYDGLEVARRFADGRTAFLAKPFLSGELVAKIDELLGDAGREE